VALQALDLLHAAELELLGTHEQPILSSEPPLENATVEPSDEEDVPEDAIVEAANYPGLVPELAALLRANAKVAWLWTEEPSQLTVHKVPKARQLNLVLHRAKACGNPLSTSVDDIPRFMAYFKDVVDYGANHFNLAKRAWAEFAGRAFPDKASFAKKVYASIQATCTGRPLHCKVCAHPLLGKHHGGAWSKHCAWWLCGKCGEKMDPVPPESCPADVWDEQRLLRKQIALNKVERQLACRAEYETLADPAFRMRQGSRGCGKVRGICAEGKELLCEGYCYKTCKACLSRWARMDVAAALLERFGRGNPPWAELETERRSLLDEMCPPKRIRMIRCAACPDAKRRRV
jgi:hypothetical protein